MNDQVKTWVIYQMTLYDHPGGVRAVCQQGEWERIELRQPGYHHLVRAGIPSEGEAERLVRAELVA